MSLSAVQGERTQWAAGGGTAKDAGEPRHDASLPPSLPASLVGVLLLGVPRSSCSSGGESADVSWVFRSYRLTLRRRWQEITACFSPPVLCL